MDLDQIISRADHLRTYGNATHIGELAGMVAELAQDVKELRQRPIMDIPCVSLNGVGESAPLEPLFGPDGQVWNTPELPVNQGPLIQ